MTSKLGKGHDHLAAGLVGLHDAVRLTDFVKPEDPGRLDIKPPRRRVRPTKQNAHGYVDDRLRRPATPSTTSPPAQPPSTGLMLTRGKVAAMS
jgi:hypothetical protein